MRRHTLGTTDGDSHRGHLSTVHAEGNNRHRGGILCVCVYVCVDARCLTDIKEERRNKTQQNIIIKYLVLFICLRVCVAAE
jgi:hypothetical protein